MVENIFFLVVVYGFMLQQQNENRRILVFIRCMDLLVQVTKAFFFMTLPFLSVLIRIVCKFQSQAAWSNFTEQPRHQTSHISQNATDLVCHLGGTKTLTHYRIKQLKENSLKTRSWHVLLHSASQVLFNSGKIFAKSQFSYWLTFFNNLTTNILCIPH